MLSLLPDSSLHSITRMESVEEDWLRAASSCHYPIIETIFIEEKRNWIYLVAFKIIITYIISIWIRWFTSNQICLQNTLNGLVGLLLSRNILEICLDLIKEIGSIDNSAGFAILASTST